MSIFFLEEIFFRKNQGLRLRVENFGLQHYSPERVWSPVARVSASCKSKNAEAWGRMAELVAALGAEALAQVCLLSDKCAGIAGRGGGHHEEKGFEGNLVHPGCRQAVHPITQAGGDHLYAKHQGRKGNILHALRPHRRFSLLRPSQASSFPQGELGMGVEKYWKFRA